MLFIDRDVGSKTYFTYEDGTEVVITIASKRDQKVTLAIDAPMSVTILRDDANNKQPRDQSK